MARPTKQGLDYYPKDVKAKYDTKFKYVESKNSVIARLVIYELWDLIYGENGYFLKFDNIQRVLFLGDMPINDEQLVEILDSCFEIGLFEKSLFEKYQILTSESIQKRYMEAVGRRAKVSIISDYFLLPKNSFYNINWVNVNINSINVNNNSINDDIYPQSKVNKIKVNKSKLNNSEITQPYLDQIESISESEAMRNVELNKKFKLYSDTYPKKTKKFEARELFGNLSDDEIEKVILGAQNVLELSKTMTPDEYKYLKNQATFISDSEYLDYQVLRSTKQEAPVGSKSPDWYEPNYVNETTPEEQAELDRIRQEMLAKMG